MTFDGAMRRFASLTEDSLAAKWSWRGRDLTVREALYRTLEDHHAALAASTPRGTPESARILVVAERAFGDLRGLLTGRDSSVLDAVPQPGEWALREVLRHMIVVERRYALQTRYAAERSDAEPIRMSDERLRAADAVDVTGDADDVLARFAAAREDTHRRLASIPDAALSRPSVWAGHDIDVRFRLLRFAAHLVEHTVQCEKALVVLGRIEEEGRRIVRRIWTARAELAVIATSEALRGLDAALAERAATVEVALGR